MRLELGEKVELRRFKRVLKAGKRGSISIEAAIVIIAFMIVATSFAFMIINSGLLSSQVSSGTVEQQLQLTQSAIEVSGSVLGYCNGTGQLTHLIVPIRLAVDKPFVLVKEQVKVGLTLSGGRAYADIYNGTIHNLQSTSLKDILRQVDQDAKGTTKAYTVWIGNDDGDDVFDPNEKVLLIVTLSSSDYVGSGGSIKVELVPSKGSPFTVERVVLNPISGEFIDLG